MYFNYFLVNETSANRIMRSNRFDKTTDDQTAHAISFNFLSTIPTPARTSISQNGSNLKAYLNSKQRYDNVTT